MPKLCKVCDVCCYIIVMSFPRRQNNIFIWCEKSASYRRVDAAVIPSTFDRYLRIMLPFVQEIYNDVITGEKLSTITMFSGIW